VLGYLAAGDEFGPWGIAIVRDLEALLHFSELGVDLLLFLIGLELKPATLWAMRRQVLGTGGLQVVLTTAVLAGVALALGVPVTGALVLGMALSLSSTAIALQIVKEKNLLVAPIGRETFAVLLFQDIAVIPMLAVLPMLGAAAAADGAAGGPVWLGLLKALAVVAGLIVVGRLLVRPVFRLIAAAHLREVFTAFALLIVLGIALLMQQVNLSMALGTFLAGVILADSEYRHELEIDIEPFKGLLLGLFFMSVGMSIDFHVFQARPVLVPALVIAVVALKAALLFGIGKIVKLPRGQSTPFALVMSQVGEFAFVLFGLGTGSGILSREVADVASAVVALSMLTTPFLMIFNDKVIAPRLARAGERAADVVTGAAGNVIIAGFGRVGQVVGRLLHAHGVPTTVLDHDPTQIDLVRRFGYTVFYGDATRIDLLEAAGAHAARLLVVTIDDPETSMTVVKLARQHFPSLPVLARARNRNHAWDLIDAGIPEPVRETFESSVTLGVDALRALGFSAYRARRSALRFRRHDLEMMRSGAALRKTDVKSLTSSSVAAREAFARLIASDAEEMHLAHDDAWG
jgi:glutathione-regulated potassium-efflux system ancillary protein KefC